MTWSFDIEPGGLVWPNPGDDRRALRDAPWDGVGSLSPAGDAARKVVVVRSPEAFESALNHRCAMCIATYICDRDISALHYQERHGLTPVVIELRQECAHLGWVRN